MGEIISNFPMGAEDITPEIQENRNLIETAIEQMAGRKTGADINPEDVLLGKSGYKGQELVVGTFDKDKFEQEVAEANRNGKYVWGLSNKTIISVDALAAFLIDNTNSDKVYIYRTVKKEAGLLVGVDGILVSPTEAVFTTTERPYCIDRYGRAYSECVLDLTATPETRFVKLKGKPCNIKYILEKFTTSDNPDEYPYYSDEEQNILYEKIPSAKGVFFKDFNDAGYALSATVRLKLIHRSMFYQSDAFLEVTTMEVIADKLEYQAFGECLDKVKTLKLFAIDMNSDYPFLYVARGGQDCNIFISNDCVDIYKTCFNGCGSKVKFYCEAPSQPSGWDSGWNQSKTVTWGVTEAEFDAL